MNILTAPVLRSQAVKTGQAWETGDLEELFSVQIKTLSDRDCPERIIAALADQQNAVIKKASQIAFENASLPILPVIPEKFLDRRIQASMMRYRNNIGCHCLKSEVIIDMVKTPEKPYFIYGAKTDHELLGQTAEMAEKIIEKRYWQRPLTAMETISFCIHTNVLSRQKGVDAVGSRVRHGVPSVYLSDKHIPELDFVFNLSSNPDYGAASCIV